MPLGYDLAEDSEKLLSVELLRCSRFRRFRFRFELEFFLFSPGLGLGLGRGDGGVLRNTLSPSLLRLLGRLRLILELKKARR